MSVAGPVTHLSAAQVEALAADFDRDGYVVVPGALSRDHVDELLATLEEFRPTLLGSGLRKHADVLDGGRTVPGLDVRGMVFQRRQARGGHGGGSGDGGGRWTTGKFPFLHLVDQPSAFTVALRCLGNPAIGLLTSHLIESPPRPPGSARNIGWHTDGESSCACRLEEDACGCGDWPTWTICCIL